jgi:hypothetical protein
MTDNDETAVRPTTPAPPVVPTPPAPATPAAPAATSDLRPAFRRLGSGLLIYGTIGLILAILSLVAMLYVSNRIGSLADRTETQVESIVATLDQTSTVLTDASATARSFAGTLERTPPTIQSAADTIGSVRSQLDSVSSQLGLFSILGANPLSGVATVFGTIADGLEGLDTQLSQVAGDLGDNKEKLLTNADSLEALGARLDAVADELRAGVVQDSLTDVQFITTLLGLVLVIWIAVPAVGALFLGRWLRRELAPAV